MTTPWIDPKRVPNPIIKLFTLQQLLDEVYERGITETYYTDLGMEIANGAKSLMDRLPGSMLEAQAERQ